jgi:hypothetical protein
MNDKPELLRTEAIDLISRAKDLIDVLRAEERRGEGLETAANHLADARNELEASAPEAQPPSARRRMTSE